MTAYCFTSGKYFRAIELPPELSGLSPERASESMKVAPSKILWSTRRSVVGTALATGQGA